MTDLVTSSRLHSSSKVINFLDRKNKLNERRDRTSDLVKNIVGNCNTGIVNMVDKINAHEHVRKVKQFVFENKLTELFLYLTLKSVLDDLTEDEKGSIILILSVNLKPEIVINWLQYDDTINYFSQFIRKFIDILFIERADKRIILDFLNNKYVLSQLNDEYIIKIPKLLENGENEDNSNMYKNKFGNMVFTNIGLKIKLNQIIN